MEIRNWTYEEYPDFTEEIEGHPLHLQIIIPQTRNTQNSTQKYPCLVYVQGSAWMEQNVGAKSQETPFGL